MADKTQSPPPLWLIKTMVACHVAVYRLSGGAFATQQALLNRDIGLANTMLMLTSSLFVARGVEAVAADPARFRRQVLWAMVCGAGFVVLKAVEWGARFRAGITIQSSDFFRYYFALSGIHLAHVLVGLGVLALIRARSRRIDGDLRLIEGGACFWHLVDILWVVLFPLLYLVRA